MNEQDGKVSWLEVRGEFGGTGRPALRHGAKRLLMLVALVLVASSGCSSGSGSNGTAGAGTGTIAPTATPVIAAAAAQNGAQVVSMTDSASSAIIYYTTDGTVPTSSSPRYLAPFLVASNLTVQAVAQDPGYNLSAVASQSFSPNLASGTLVWSEEFSNSTGVNAQPNPKVWTYDSGNSGFGNNELENYCAWGSGTAPCDPSAPNAFVGTDGNLHIVAEQSTTGLYTSARLKTQGLFSFQYGRVEFRAKVPEAQGFWPAAWLVGNTIATVNWPACGEQDVMERVNAAGAPDWNEGSIHGTGFTGGNLGTRYEFPTGQNAAGWHTYGMIWSKGSIAYYVDDPTHPYVTYTPSSITGFNGAVWPFDSGPSFMILNLAVGGSWPGSPNGSTPFPSEMLVDYIRIYTN